MGDENPIRTLGDYSKPSHEGYRNTIELLVGNNVVHLRSDTIRLVQNGCSFHRLRCEDPNQHLKDFLKLVDSLDLDGSITTCEDLTTRFLTQFFPPGRTAKLHNDILMFQQHHGESLSKAWTRFKDLLQKVPHHGHLPIVSSPKFYDHVNPVTRRTIDQSAGDARLSKFKVDFKQQQSEMTNKTDTVLKAIIDRITGTLPNDTVKNSKLSTYPVLFALLTQLKTRNAQLKPTEDGDVMFIKIIPKDDNSSEEEPEVGGQEVEYFDIFPTRSELAYHKYLMCGPIPSIFLQNPIIMEGRPLNLKILCNIGHVHVEKAYIDLKSPLYIMARMMYNWIMRRKLDPMENTNGRVSNFTGRIKGSMSFHRNFTYIVDFMIIKDISSIIDPRLSQVVLGKPFV
ncbi:MAK10-like protein [Tanacetum coccineum]|uniref:MAK10-like protein n=1 Tax=Tanacetum coccineum TaxID=301880 RepID=A0ABQ5A0H9_9ASTR